MGSSDMDDLAHGSGDRVSWHSVASDLWQGRNVQLPGPFGRWNNLTGWRLLVRRKVGHAGVVVTVIGAGYAWLFLTGLLPEALGRILLILGYWSLWLVCSGPRPNPTRSSRKARSDRWMYAMARVVDVQPEPHPSFAVELLNSWRAQPENQIAIATMGVLSLVTTVALMMAVDVKPVAQLGGAAWFFGPVIPLVWLGR